MDWIVLRLVHVLGGAFWFGAVLTNFVFVQPAVLGLGPEGQRVMVHVLRDRRFVDAVLGAAVLTAIAGGVLFWRDTNGLDPTLAFGASGLGFTIGGVAGVLAVLLFMFVGYPNTRRLIAVGRQLEAEGRPPTADEQALLARSQAALRPIGIAVPVLLTIAAAAMATARYWGMVL
jgi:uncharacterized membrane protein